MTLEEKWIDYKCLCEFGKTWKDIVESIRTDLSKFKETFKDEFDYLFYYLSTQKIIPSYNYIKYRSCDCRNFYFCDYSKVPDLYRAFFEHGRLTIFVDDEIASSVGGFDFIKKEPEIANSKHYDALCKLIGMPKKNLYLIICTLAAIAEENGAKSPYFTIAFNDIRRALNENNDTEIAKYGKIVIAKHKYKEKKEELEDIIKLSFFEGGDNFDILRYKTPEANFSRDEMRFIRNNALKKFPAFDAGAFAKDNSKFYIVNVNVHKMTSDAELKRCCKCAAVMASIIAANEQPLVSLVGLCDNNFNFYNLYDAASAAKDGMNLVSYKIKRPLRDNATCVYENPKLYDIMLIKPGLEPYKERHFEYTFDIKPDTPYYSYLLENFSEYATQNPFYENRYRLSIPLKISDSAYTENEERLFSRLIKAENITKQWICGGWISGLYLNFLRFTISPSEKDEKLITDYILDNFKLFPCVSIKKNICKHRELTKEEYKILNPNGYTSNNKR